MKQKLTEYNAVPEDMPTPDEMWAKLTGADKEFTLAEFQAAIDKAVGK